MFPKITLAFWLITSLYFGTGGLTRLENYSMLKKSYTNTDTAAVQFEGIKFINKFAVLKFIEERQAKRIYPWVNNIPLFVAYIITACTFSLLGTLTGIFKLLAFNKITIEEVHYISLPILGMLTGIVILGVAMLFPTLIITGNDTDIKPMTLMFLCLFGGLFADGLYTRIQSIFNKKILIDE